MLEVETRRSNESSWNNKDSVASVLARQVYVAGESAGLGAVGGYKDLARFTTLGGTLFVFALPET